MQEVPTIIHNRQYIIIFLKPKSLLRRLLPLLRQKNVEGLALTVTADGEEEPGLLQTVDSGVGLGMDWFF